MNPKVDKYLKDGCMRCKYGATPQCKVNKWHKELELIRKILLETDLVEVLKWGVPCYTFSEKNILIASAFKEYVCISFFKGVLINKHKDLLIKQGASSQAARVLKFTDANQILKAKGIITDMVQEAIEIEKTGKKVEFLKNPEPIPQELLILFEEDKILKKAFFSLAPGKQRGYIIYFSKPKSAQSKLSRIEKCREKILRGEAVFSQK